MIIKSVKLVTVSSSFVSRTFSTQLSHELQSLQEICKKFSKEELKPVADQLDRDGKFPKKQIHKLGKLGVLGIGVASDYGGANMNTLALSIAVEELSQGCGSTGAIVSIHNCLYANLLNRVGTHEQKLKYLKPFVDGNKIGAFALSESGRIKQPIGQQVKGNINKILFSSDAGSDVASMTTIASKDGNNYILNGTKAWVTSGIESEACIVFATVDKSLGHKGITAFIVDMDATGVRRGNNERKLGVRATSTCSLTLDNVRVGPENILGAPCEGFKLAMEQLEQGRIGIASQALGIAQASLDTAINYASQRIAFKKPILEMSAVQNRLAEMALKIEASRLLIRQAAQFQDENLKSTKYTSMAKWHASETATFCAHNCIQILGGMGVVEDFPAERFYRDARITEIYAGSTDIQKRIIADQVRREYNL